MAHDHDSNNFETSDQFLYCHDRLSGFSLALTDSVNPCIIRKTNNNKTIVITVLKWKCKYFDFLKKKSVQLSWMKSIHHMWCSDKASELRWKYKRGRNTRPHPDKNHILKGYLSPLIKINSYICSVNSSSDLQNHKFDLERIITRKNHNSCLNKYFFSTSLFRILSKDRN